MQEYEYAFFVRVRQRGADLSDGWDRLVWNMRLRQGHVHEVFYAVPVAPAGPATITHDATLIMGKPIEG